MAGEYATRTARFSGGLFGFKPRTALGPRRYAGASGGTRGGFREGWRELALVAVQPATRRNGAVCGHRDAALASPRRSGLTVTRLFLNPKPLGKQLQFVYN